MLDLQEQTTETISSILNKYLIDHKIDNDGDIAIESPVRLYVRVLSDNKILRFMSFIHQESLTPMNEGNLNKFVTFINGGGYTVKYSLMPNKTIICEYGLVLGGMVDENFIIKSLKNFEKEVSKARGMALNYELIKSIINKNDQ